MPKKLLEPLLMSLTDRTDRLADVPILQNADPYLETAGEDLRRRIFITESADGALQCLRPEFTIPICLKHHNAPARYAYGGTVFRQGREGEVEFQQVGLEDLGATDNITADTACVTDMMAALETAGVKNITLTLGEQNLFAVLVKALNLPNAIAARLERNFGEPEILSRIISNLSSIKAMGDDELHTMARDGDRAALVKRVEAMMEQGGLSPRSGRSPQDIAQRLIEKVAETSFEMSAEHEKTLRAFLELEAPLNEAEEVLLAFSHNHGVDFAEALSGFGAFLKNLAAEGLDLSLHTYRASFGRKLEYYTGLLFEAHAPNVSDAIAGGGRYDRLCSLLGANAPVPAVGFSITLDRLESALDAQDRGATS